MSAAVRAVALGPHRLAVGTAALPLELRRPWRPLPPPPAFVGFGASVLQARCGGGGGNNAVGGGAPGSDGGAGTGAVGDELRRRLRAAAAAAAAGLATADVARTAKCREQIASGDVDAGTALRNFLSATSAALAGSAGADADIARLLETLRADAARLDPPLGSNPLAWLTPAETTKIVDSIVLELDMVGKVLREHFGHLDLSVHPFAVYYLLAERSELRTPAWKETELFEPTAWGPLGLPSPDLTADMELFTELLEHCSLADCAYERNEQDVRAYVSKVWEDYEWDMPVCKVDAEPGRPAHFVAVRRPDAGKRLKGRVVFAVRGTKEIADVLTDALMDTKPFQGGVAHSGVVRASASLCQSYAEKLRDFEKQGYEVVVVGHSLGAATAAAATIELRRSYGLQSVRCVCFAPPPTVDPSLAKECAPYLMSVVHDDDFIPRSQVASLLALYRELLGFDWLSPARREAAELVAASPEWLQSALPPGDVLAWLDSKLGDMFETRRKANSTEAAKMDVAIGQAEHRHILHVPGFVLHLVRGANGPSGYVAARTEPEHLQHLEMSMTMVFDHFLDGYLGALRALAGGADVAAEEEASRARESLRACMPADTPGEVHEAVSKTVKSAFRLRSKVLKLAQSRPDTS